MFCPNCGCQLDGSEKFCSKCGVAVQKTEEKRFCSQCGKELSDDEQYCPICGTASNNRIRTQTTQYTFKLKDQPLDNVFINYFCEYKKSIPAFIIGLIGSIFGMFGGICTTMCSCGTASNSAFLLIFGGAVIGMIGSCICLKKARIGSLIQFLGAFMIIIRAYSQGAEIMTIFSFVLLLTASIIGIVSAHLLDLLKMFKKK